MSAVAVSQLAPPDNTLFYNSRGLPGTDGDGKIVGNAALIYVLDEDYDFTEATPGPTPFKKKPGKRIEPLVLRAAAGECINVTLKNRLPQNLLQPAGQTPYTRWGSESYFNKGGGGATQITTSLNVGLHPQQVGMDILKSNGVNIGRNGIQTVPPGEKTTLQWYAGSVAVDGKYTPVELGAIGLSPADPLMQHPFGLLGALIIEPKGSTWHVDDNSRASATVTPPAPAAKFREFILVLQDDVQQLQLTGLTYDPITFSQVTKDRPLLSTTTTTRPDFSRAFNYRTEPVPYRSTDPKWLTMDQSEAPLGIARALSNSQVLADPQTPVLAVSKGTPTRLRVVHPGGLSEQTFTLAGHPWQEEPFQNNSQEIGDNAASQWFGGRDSFGANDQVNIVLKSAGGRKQVTGDYLYRSFIGSEFQFGLWGVMRVGEPGKDTVAIAHVANDQRGWGYVISGSNTVNPDKGEMAKRVTIRASVRPPNGKDDRDAKEAIVCTAPVDPVTGAWSSRSCPNTSQGTLIVGSGKRVQVASDGGGEAVVTGYIPSLPPDTRKPPPAPSADQIAKAIQNLLNPKEDPEMVQFKGERTPQAVIQQVRPRDPIPGAEPRANLATRPSTQDPPSADAAEPGPSLPHDPSEERVH